VSHVKKPCSCKQSHPRYGRCRRSRPLCRLNRRTCGCSGYHYPHRPGSPLCEHNPRANDARNLILYGATGALSK